VNTAPHDSDGGDGKSSSARPHGSAWLRGADPVQAALEADERVIWRGLGSGFDHHPYLAALLGVIAVIAIVWAWPKMPLDQIRLPELQPVVGALMFILILGTFYQRAGYAKRQRHFYTLTDRRLFIFVSGQQTPPVSLARTDGKLGHGIAAIAIETRVSASDIKIFVTGSDVPYVLYGIDKPLEVASLIKSTLGLGIDIQEPAQ
jgi:hypothetical protein